MSGFDRFAEVIAAQVARAWFFAACVLTIVLWLPSIFVIRNVDTWQLIVNTVTTCITFLLVALLHNTQERFELRTDLRLEVILAHLGLADPCAGQSKDA